MSIGLGIKLLIKHKLAGWRSRIIGSHADAVLTRGYNGLLLVPADDFSVGRHLAFEGEYDRHTIELISTWLHSNSRLLIVGTHVGALLIPLARLAREVVGIEANPETFELLKMNLALNGISNARVLSLAASDKRGDLEFLLSRTNSGGSKIRPAVERQEFVYDDPKIATVNAARLDDVLCGQSFDLVLMDIEGSEYFALLGMQNILAEARNLVIELLPNHIENVAGISAEQFLKAIPESFRYARFIGEDTGEVMSRAQLSELLPALWKRNYFRGWDIRFSTDRL